MFVNKLLPSSEKATLETTLEVSRFCISSPVVASHSLIVLSRDPDATVLLSGEKATEMTKLSCLSSFCLYSITYSKDKMATAPEARPIAIEASKVE